MRWRKIKAKHPLLSVKEVANFLQVSTKTVYRLARAGEIPSYKFGHLWRFPYGAISELTLERYQTYAKQRDRQLKKKSKALPSRHTILGKTIRKAYKKWERIQKQEKRRKKST